MEYVLNARATVVDPHTVEAAGTTFRTRNVVLGIGARQRPLQIPGADLPGIYDFATLVENLDYEPSRCVIIGGSKVAVEYGTFFQAAGCQTTTRRSRRGGRRPRRRRPGRRSTVR